MALTRSEQMSRIRGKDTAPELLLAGALAALEVAYELQFRTAHGKVDLALLDRRTLVCIDGCFFHGCPEHYVRPRSRTEFWARKLRENVDRDRRQTLALEAEGWRVERLWEHEVFEDADALVDRILEESASPRDQWRVVLVDAVDATGSLERRHHERLRNPKEASVVEQTRHTRKWARAKRRPSAG